MNKSLLTPGQIKEFNEEGLLIIKGFYNPADEIEPIQFGIWKILGSLSQKYIRYRSLNNPFHRVPSITVIRN